MKEQKWELVEGKKVKVASTEKGEKVKREELIAWLKSKEEALKEWSL